MNAIIRLRQYLMKRQIIIAVTLAVLFSLLLTGINMYLYTISDASRIDASTPGREALRAKLNDTTETVKFDSSGKLDAAALADFQKLFDKEKSGMSVLGKFEGDELTLNSLMATVSNE